MQRHAAATVAAPKFDKLDAMRGIAAWAVLTYHMMQDALPAVVPRAYLAVDFFFALSGFVVSAAYTPRLRSPHNINRYLLTRLIRLYPLVLLGAILGGLGQLQIYTPPVLAVLLITGALLIPTSLAPKSEGHVAFAANPPSWSLFFEVLINIAFGYTSRFLTVRTLAVVVCVSGVALTLASLAIGGTNGGVYWPTLWVGVPHVCFSFPLGALLHRLWAQGRLPRWDAPLSILMLALVAVFSIPRFSGALDILVDLIAVVVVFPALIIAGLKPGSGPVATLMGELSYPGYILQAAFAQHVKNVPQNIHLGAPITRFLLLLSLQAPYLIFVFLAYRVFDRPVRGWLNQRLHVAMRTPAQTAP